MIRPHGPHFAPALDWLCVLVPLGCTQAPSAGRPWAEAPPTNLLYPPTLTALPHLCSSDASRSGECAHTWMGGTGHTTPLLCLLPLASGVQPSTFVACRFCHMAMLWVTPVSPLHGHLPRTTTSLSGISAYNRHFHLSGTYACCTDGSTTQLTTLLHGCSDPL